MATTDFLPGREAELVTWIGTFKTLIVANFATYGLTSAQSTSYSTAATNFVAAYNLAAADATRSPSNIIAKDQAKATVVALTRQLAGIIQKFPGTTDQMRSDLGLTVPAARTPVPPPNAAPVLETDERYGTIVRVRLHDANGTGRGKPPGVAGARIYSHIGTTPPIEIEDWVFQGQATRTIVDVEFPAATAPGTMVWFTACWYNAKGQTGPGCAPVSTYIAGGEMQEAA